MLPALPFFRHFDVPSTRMWRLITDTRTWPLWGPTVLKVDCADRYIRAGSIGRVCTPLGVWLPFVIGAFKPQSYWDWRVAGVTATGHRVESVGPNRCRLTFTVPAWAFGYGLVCRLALLRIDRCLKQAEKQNGQRPPQRQIGRR